MAFTIEDFLFRRTRCLILDARECLSIVEKTAKIIAKELGKNKEWVKQQTEEITFCS